MKNKLYSLVLVALFVVFVSACTTTTKTISREVSVSSETEINNAKLAFKQKDYTVAAKLLKPLAEQGRDDAQYALGYLYFHGMGVVRNKSLAVQLFNSAAANGNKNAKQALDHLPASDKTLIDLRDKKETISGPIPDSSGEPMVSEEIPVEDSVIVESKTPQIAETEDMTTEMSGDVDLPVGGQELTDGEEWVVRQPGNNFTIQLIVLADESALKKFINENNLQDKSVYYRTQKNGKTYYALVSGSFESYSLAKEVATGMSSELKTVKPWIRNISNIQKLLSIR